MWHCAAWCCSGPGRRHRRGTASRRHAVPWRGRAMVRRDEAVLQYGRGGGPAAVPAGAGRHARVRATARRATRSPARSTAPATSSRSFPHAQRSSAAGIVFNVGHPVADAGDDQSAGPIMRLVVEYQPENYMALYHAGMSEYILGHTDLARTQLERFLEIYTREGRLAEQRPDGARPDRRPVTGPALLASGRRASRPIRDPSARSAAGATRSSIRPGTATSAARSR